MTNIPMYGFGSAPAHDDYPLEALGHYVLGAGEDEWFDTPEAARAEFAKQFDEVFRHAKGLYLFVRKPATMIVDRPFEGGVRYRMVGRFSIMKLKEK